MSARAIEISSMVDMLPESEQELAYEFVKRIVLAWDPDYTKLTPAEAKELKEIHEACENGEVYSYEQVWE